MRRVGLLFVLLGLVLGGCSSQTQSVQLSPSTLANNLVQTKLIKLAKFCEGYRTAIASPNQGVNFYFRLFSMGYQGDVAGEKGIPPARPVFNELVSRC